MRIIFGILIAATSLIALHIWGAKLLCALLSRGDDTEWGDVCKAPAYRYFNGGKP